MSLSVLNANRRPCGEPAARSCSPLLAGRKRSMRHLWGTPAPRLEYGILSLPVVLAASGKNSHERATKSSSCSFCPNARNLPAPSVSPAAPLQGPPQALRVGFLTAVVPGHLWVTLGHGKPPGMVCPSSRSPCYRGDAGRSHQHLPTSSCPSPAV